MINAEFKDQIEKRFSELGKKLKSQKKHNADEKIIDLKDTIAALEHLSSPFLLFFDNAEDKKSIVDYIPNSPKAKILVTSRKSFWESSGIQISGFSEEDSIKYLKQVLDRDESSENLEKVARLIGGWPLALQQAAAWARSNCLPLSKYCECILSVLPRDEIIEKTLDSIVSTFSKEGIIGLKILAWCNSQDIPIAIVSTIIEKNYDIGAWYKCRGNLQTICIITDDGNNHLNVHRLVHSYLQKPEKLEKESIKPMLLGYYVSAISDGAY